MLARTNKTTRPALRLVESSPLAPESSSNASFVKMKAEADRDTSRQMQDRFGRSEGYFLILGFAMGVLATLVTVNLT